MTEIQILWGINTSLIALLALFLKFWLSKMDTKIEGSLSAKTCDERHAEVKKDCETLFKHKHSPVNEEGQGGYLIIP